MIGHLFTGSHATCTLLPGVSAVFVWQFGDGVSVRTTEDSVSHAFSTRGVYEVNVTTESDACNATSNVTTIAVQDDVYGLAITRIPAAVGGPATILLNVTSGSDYECNLRSGNGEPKKVGVLAHAGGEPLVNYELTTGVYRTAGVYVVVVICYNNVSRATAGGELDVQDVLYGLEILDSAHSVDEGFRLRFSLINGTRPTFKLTFQGAQRIVLYDDVENTGTSDVITVASPGEFIVNVSATNLVSSLTTFAYVTVDVPIDTPQCGPDESAVAVSTRVYFWADLRAGSRVMVVWDFQDGPNGTFETGVGELWPGRQERSHAFATAGTFVVRVVFSNPLAEEICSETVYVLSPVADLSIHSNTPVAMTTGENQSVATLYFTIISGTSPPSNASVSFNFGDGGTQSWDFTVGVKYTHTFVRSGRYVVNATVSNAINSMTYSHVVDVLMTISGMHVDCKPNVAIVGAEMSFRVSMETGDQVTLYFDWGNPPDAVTTIKRIGKRYSLLPLTASLVSH